MNDEIALFIDFENIRYSLLNVRHREPDPQELIGVARRYGTVMVARAYADWNRQPDFFKGSLTAAMIDRVDCPAKLRGPRPNGSNTPYVSYNAYTPAALPRQYDQDEDQEEDLMRDGGAEELDESAQDLGDQQAGDDTGADEPGDDEDLDDGYEEEGEEQPRHFEPANHRPYAPGSQYHAGGPVTTQSTVDLNMLMDIIETVFDRPTINTYVLMTGDRDFTRICARLKLRLNKHVIVVGIPGTVSRDLISAAGGQFIPLGGGGATFGRPGLPRPDFLAQGPVEPEEPGFIQFLDYIDSHWAWRTIGGVANFIGDPFNPKNRFRGRLTRDTARELLHTCIDHNLLIVTTDQVGGESLQLNRAHPAVQAVLNESQA
ncbi:MAG TPA: NYN domain-containing protein [Ktedonobacterales bacterium]|nr:NYN domain-containing protein [Ktedonobacterales bacterium]